ncbi:MAG: prepilin-type N-terminal cleavage/methylation domain-containing protein, partial [Halothiobacillus sp.]|nr:prepilin-type N-terminal cleavage/methylation domain-containing protein [Halothiobacillus sp.]
MQRSRVGQVGFTLLEVLIALVILAIALGAVIKVSGQSGEILQRLRA